MLRKIALLALVENDAALQYIDFLKIKLEGFFLSFNRKESVLWNIYICQFLLTFCYMVDVDVFAKD